MIFETLYEHWRLWFNSCFIEEEEFGHLSYNNIYTQSNQGIDMIIFSTLSYVSLSNFIFVL